MVTQVGYSYAQDDGNDKQGLRIVVTAVIVGLLLGAALTFLLSGMNGLGLLGMWVLSMGMAWISVAIVSYRRYGEARWGMAIAGQAMGAVAILLLVFATI
jgi:hypothetical protein